MVGNAEQEKTCFRVSVANYDSSQASDYAMKQQVG
jgi:hypothetical protein